MYHIMQHIFGAKNAGATGFYVRLERASPAPRNT